MPTPIDPARYPEAFAHLFARVAGGETISIPSGAPHALKARLWGFQRALRLAGKSELADSIEVAVDPPGKSPTAVIVRLRSTTVHAKEVEAALSMASGEKSPSDEFFDRFDR